MLTLSCRLRRCTVDGQPAQLSYIADMARALFQNVDCDFEALVDFIAAREGYSADAAMAQITTAMMRKHVRRAVPEASVVLPRIQAVQAYYSLVVDEQRQLPLFTTGAYDFVSLIILR